MNKLTRRACSGHTFIGDLTLLLVIIGCVIGYAWNVIEWAAQ